MIIEVGTLVRGKDSCSRTAGLFGVVLEDVHGWVSVEWEKDIGGHTGSTFTGKMGHCWNVTHEDVEALPCSIR